MKLKRSWQAGLAAALCCSVLAAQEPSAPAFPLTNLAWTSEIDLNASSLPLDQVDFLNSYMSSIASPTNEELPQETKNQLALLIALHADLLKPDALDRFYTYQLGASGLKPSEIQRLKTVMVMIRNGQGLTKKQTSFLKQVIESNVPKVPTIVLQPLLQPMPLYVRTHTADFSEGDFDLVKKAVFQSVGKTSTERSLINKMASPDFEFDENLSDKQIKALNRVILLARLDALDVCDEKKLIVLQGVINRYQDHFEGVPAFNRKVDSNSLVVAFKKNNPDFRPPLRMRSPGKEEQKAPVERGLPNAPRASGRPEVTPRNG